MTFYSLTSRNWRYFSRILVQIASFALLPRNDIPIVPLDKRGSCHYDPAIAGEAISNKKGEGFRLALSKRDLQ